MYLLWGTRPECAGDSLHLKFFSHFFFSQMNIVRVQVVVEHLWLCSVWWFCCCMYCPSQPHSNNMTVQEADQETVEVHIEI